MGQRRRLGRISLLYTFRICHIVWYELMTLEYVNFFALGSLVGINLQASNERFVRAASGQTGEPARVADSVSERTVPYSALSSID